MLSTDGILTILMITKNSSSKHSTKMFSESKKSRLQQRTRRLNSGGFSIPLSLSSDEQKRLAIWHLHLTESSFGHPMKSHHIIRRNPVFELSMDLTNKHETSTKFGEGPVLLFIFSLRLRIFMVAGPCSLEGPRRRLSPSRHNAG